MTDRVALNLGLEKGENLSTDASPVQVLARDITKPSFVRLDGEWIGSIGQYDIGLHAPAPWSLLQVAGASNHWLKHAQDFTAISSTISPEAFSLNLCLRRAATRLRVSTRAEKAIAKYR
jgi:hypothetical protein